jgi:hypothetical protein
MRRLRDADLPLALLAGMVLLGLALEAALYRTLLWETKLPLVALLVWGWRRRRARGD